MVFFTKKGLGDAVLMSFNSIFRSLDLQVPSENCPMQNLLLFDA